LLRKLIAQKLIPAYSNNMLKKNVSKMAEYKKPVYTAIHVRTSYHHGVNC